MTEIVVLNPDEFNAQIKQTLQEVLREELSKLQDSQSDNSYLTRKEVADLLKVSPISVDRWVKQGLLKAHKVGSRVLFVPGEVETALNEVPTLKKYKKRSQ